MVPRTVHTIDFNDPAVLTYGGPRTWESIESGDIYIGAITETGQSVLSRAYHYGDMAPVESTGKPLRFYLAQNVPNPFNTLTVLQYEIPRKTRTTLRIYSVNGQMIKTLVDAEILPGSHTVIWNGTNDLGSEIGSGIYFCILNADTFRMVRKLILVK